MTRTAACPGSFDPVTNGHLDVLRRVSRLYDAVVVVVSTNPRKNGLFDVRERIEMLTEVTAECGNVSVESLDGLLVDFCTARGIGTVVKGLRAASDYDYELRMAQMNAELAGVETLFLPTSPSYSYVSSSLVKEVAGYGGDVSGLVPAPVLERLQARLG